VETVMTRSILKCAAIFSGLGLACALVSGCEKKEEPHHDDSAASSDAGANKVSDEPDLDKAVASVADKGALGANGAADGPPPAGIFAPGAADKALAKGAPATITFGSDGAEPRVQLGPVLKPGTKRTGSIEVASQSSAEQGAIPISLSISLEAQKVKSDSDAGAPNASQVVAKITGATINAPGVPPEIAAGVAKLRGSRVEYQLSPDGAGSNFRAEIVRGVDPAFGTAVQSLGDTLMLLALPFPAKPVGVGAYWMVTTRDSVTGLDVVTYRLVKVEKVEGTAATLSLSTKRYAASPAFDVEGLPPGVPHTMSEFHGSTDGSLVVNAGDSFPKSGQLDSVLAAALGAGDPKTKQRPMVQLQSRAVISF
jgi:hypothetical protein